MSENFPDLDPDLDPLDSDIFLAIPKSINFILEFFSFDDKIEG
jgi:hypothetical protein